jgi:glycosyltransferase involved in cell wall biosynthesis
MRILNYSHEIAALDNKELISLSASRIPDNKLHHLPNAVDTEKFVPKDTHKSRVKLGMDTNKKYILYVGRLTSTKNVPQLVSSMERIKKQFPKCNLVVVGSGKGTEIEQINQIIDDKELSDSVSLVGHIEQKELVDYYNAADIAVFPSDAEGLGMVALECSACGTPFIGTDAHSSEVFIAGKTYVNMGESTEVKIADSVIFSLNNRECVADIANNARQATLKNFGKESIVSKTLDIYKSAIKRFNE